MANYNPFKRRDDQDKEDKNWFMKTSIKVAAGAGTAFGIYGLWKMRGPAKKILEEAMDKEMKRKISIEQSNNMDKHSFDIAENWNKEQRDLLNETWGEGKNPFFADPKESWGKVDTPEYTKINISIIETDIISDLEREASYLSPNAEIRKIQPGEHFSGADWIAINKKKTKILRKVVSLSGSEAEQFARLRQEAIAEYLETYMFTGVEREVAERLEEMSELSTYFSSKDYLDSDRITDGFGKKSVDRITTIHNAYMEDKQYADIYQRKIKQLYRRFKLFSHRTRTAKIGEPERVQFNGGGYRKALYGNILGEVIDPKSLASKPLSALPLFDSTNPEVKMTKDITSMGSNNWGPENRFSKLQQTNYTGRIFNLDKTLKGLQDEGNIAGYSITLIDYGTKSFPDKRLRISLLHTDAAIGKNKSYQIEIPLGIDGRIPGATPGLQYAAERYHIVGNVYGKSDEMVQLINTTELNLIEVEKALKGSLMTGWDSFQDNPDKFVRQVNRMVRQIIAQNATANGSRYDLYNAMSVDIPAIRDLFDSSRPKFASARRTAESYISSARAMKRIINARHNKKKSVVINLDLETLDNTGASPGAAILSKNSQITKYGIVVQDMNSAKILDHFEESNWSGYKHFKNIDNRRKGTGFNDKLRKWLRDSVLPEGTPVGMEVEAYEELLKNEGAVDVGDRTAVVKRITDKVRAIKADLMKKGYSEDEIFIATKNGFMFDLRAINMDDQSFAKEFEGNFIDIQALHAFKNNALGENNALNIERVMQRLMGEIGEPGVNYSIKNQAGITNIMKALKKKGRSIQGGGTSLLNWTDPFWEYKGRAGIVKAHGSPRVDAAFVAALLMKEVASYTAESSYLDHADYMARLLKMSSGPRRPEDLIELFRMINEKYFEGFGVASFRSSSQRMISNLVANFIEPAEMSAFADPYNTSGIRRRHAMPFNLRLKKSYIDKFGGPANAANLHKQHLGEFLMTTSIEDANRALNNYIMRTDDAVNHFSNAVLADTLYTLDLEKEPTLAVSEGLAKKYEQVKIVNLQTDTLVGDERVNAKILEFNRQVDKRAKEIAGGKFISPEIIEAAEKEVAGKGDWGIDLSSEILSAGKYGGEVKTRRKSLHGRIVSALLEPDKTSLGKTSVRRLLVKVEETISGRDIFFGSQAQTPASHALIGNITVLSEGISKRILGAGKDFVMSNTPEFLKKGHIGSAKDVMISGLLKKLYTDHETTTDPATKRSIKKLIDKITRALDATPDIEGNRVIFNKKDIAYSSDLKTRVLGSTDVRLKQIIQWYKQAGIVWNKTEIEDLHKNGFRFEATFKPYMDHFKKMSRLSDEQLKATYEGWEGLTKEGLNAARDDIKAFEKMMYDNVHNTEGSVKLFRVVPQIDQGFTLGILGYGPVALYRQDARGLTNKDLTFRQDYFLGLRHTYHGQDKTTMDFVARHTFASRFDTYKSVRRTYTRFLDQLFSERLTKEPLNINALDYLLDIKQRIALQSKEAEMASRKTWSNMSAGELAAAARDRDNLLEKKLELTGAEADALKRERLEIADALNAKEGGSRILENVKGIKRFYTTRDVAKLSEIAAENNGIVAFSLPVSNNALEIDLDQVVDRFQGQMPGKPKWDAKQITSAKDRLKSILRNKLKNSTKDSPLRFNEDGKLVLGALVMDWDPMAVNQFDRLRSVDAWRSNGSTEIKMNVLRALHEWQKVVKEAGGGMGTDVSAAQDKFIRAWTVFMLTGTNADKNSQFWKSGQYAPPSLKSYAADMTQLQRSVIQLEQSRPGAFKRYRQQFKLLKEARMDTVLISEEAFKKMRMVNQNGELVSAARMIEDHFKAQNSTIGKEIAEGRRLLPGGLIERFPIPQAGDRGMQTINYLVMPKKALEALGADANAIYVNPVYWAGQGGDFDGDIIFAQLKELGIFYKYKELREANDRTFQRILETPDMVDFMKNNQIVLDSKGNVTKEVKIGNMNSVLYSKGDKTLIHTYDLKGNAKQVWVGSHMLDVSDRVGHVLNLIGGMASSSPAYATSARVSQIAESQVNTLISKELIPLTTNLLKKRVKQIYGDAHIRKNPLRVQNFVGNTLHGLAGMAQSVIDLAKHPEERAKLSKVLNFFTTGKATPEVKELYLELEKKVKGSAFDEELASADFDILSGRIEAIETVSKRNPTFKMHENAKDMYYMGKQGATVFDSLMFDSDTYFDNLFSPSKPASAMDQLNTAFSKRLGKQVDISPVFKKAGKYGAIGSAVFMGLSLFTPFGNSKSLNPIDMFTDIGDIDGQRSSISSPLELSRSQPLDMVNASFSKEAFIRQNKSNSKKSQGAIMNSILQSSMLSRVDAPFEFQVSYKGTYSNYTKSINMIGTKELKRKYE